MRSFYNPDKFFQKMKKKPELQKVLDNIDSYTEKDIDNLSGPHFPQWIKDQLKNLQTRQGRTAEEVANQIAAQMIAASLKNK